jgi:serine/threonine-protein kinase
MSAEIAEELTQQVCVALFNALQANPDNRTAKVEKFHRQLSMEPNVSALLDEDDDTAPTKKKSRLSRQTRITLIIFASVLAALLIVLGVVLLLLKPFDDSGTTSEPANSLPDYVTTTTTTKPPVKYAIPDVVGKNFYEVRNEKTAGDFVFVNDKQERNEQPAGTILSQDPAPGTSVDKGATITVIISSGPDDKVTLRDLKGLSEDWARTYLEDLGFVVKVDKLLFNTDQPHGYVDSTEPAAGTIIKKGDTVTLRVSYVDEDTDSSDTEYDDTESDSSDDEDYSDVSDESYE